MAVAFIDFHGSEGYGQAFTDSITMDYGGKPFDDIMLSLDYITQEWPWVRADRIIGLGASYGTGGDVQHSCCLWLRVNWT